MSSKMNQASSSSTSLTQFDSFLSSGSKNHSVPMSDSRTALTDPTIPVDPLPQVPNSLLSRRDTLPATSGSSGDISGLSGAEGGPAVECRKGRLSLPAAMGARSGVYAEQSGNGSGITGQGADGLLSEEPEEEGEGEDEVDEGTKGDNANGVKKRRVQANPGLISCVSCRKGKRRCEPSPLVAPSHPDAAKLPCARCRRFALECVRVEQKKRKGPAPTDLSAISDAVFGFQGSGDGGDLMEMPPTPGPGPGPILRPEAARSQSGPTMGTGSGLGIGSGGLALGLPQSVSVGMSTPSLSQGHTQGQGFGQMQGYGQRPSWDSDMRRDSGLSQEYSYPSFARAESHHSSHSPAFPILVRSPSQLTVPDNLDQVISRSVLNTIIGLFFDYVYPVTPCLHRPTFLASLAARHDKTDPVFFALTLCVLASTLVQVPRSLINLDKSEVEDLARRCVRVARAKISYIFEESVPVEISFIIISYLEGIVHLLLGNNTAHVMCVAKANHLALAMRLNEESSYEGLDPIDSEIRRRTYWLLFQADKSAACMRARTISLRLEDAASLRLPAEVDDEQITSAGIMMPTGGSTPIIAGFNIVTNLFRIMNDALLLQRRRAPPTVDSILADLQNVNELREKVIRTTKDVSPQLRLQTSMDSRASSPAHDWEAKLEARFLNFFQSAGDETHALNSYLVLQGNILGTQSVVRLVLLHTKESLLRQLAMLTQMPMHSVGTLAGMQAGEPAEDIACELLDGLNSLPVECVATNGPSLVQKVRFVAIQLMECSISPSPTTARSQRLLVQFLSVLSVIEGMYTFGKDISVE